MNRFPYVALALGVVLLSTGAARPPATQTATTRAAATRPDISGAGALLKVLPTDGEASFGFVDVPAARSSPTMLNLMFSSDADWRQSMAGRLFGTIGMTRDEAVSARYFIVLGGDEFMTVSLRMTAEPVRGFRVRAEAADSRVRATSRVAGVPVFTLKGSDLEDADAQAIAFVGDMVVAGSPDGVGKVVQALAGQYEGPVLANDKRLKAVWKALPKDRMVVMMAVGDSSPDLPFGEDPQAMGVVVNRMTDAEAEATVIGHFANAAEVAAVQQELKEDMAEEPELRAVIKAVRVSGLMITLELKGPREGPLGFLR